MASDATPGPATQRQRVAEVPSDDEVDYTNDISMTQIDTGSADQMVKKMVRFALACEYQRKPIRRADISEKVLGSEGRKFKAVFSHAQDQLRTVFGMEMVELPAREKVTLQQKRAQKAAATQSAATATKSWVLVSTLPPEYRTADILDPPAAPTSEEEAKYIGIYTLVVSLIILSGGTMLDSKLERYLRRLQMEDTTPVDDFEKTEKLFKRMEREGYVVKVKENSGTGDDEMYWMVGPRGKVEVGEDGAKALAIQVYGDLPDNDQTELDRRIERSLAMNDKPEAAQVPPDGARKQRGRKARNETRNDDNNDRGQSDDEDDD